MRTVIAVIACTAISFHTACSSAQSSSSTTPTSTFTVEHTDWIEGASSHFGEWIAGCESETAWMDFFAPSADTFVCARHTKQANRCMWFTSGGEGPFLGDDDCDERQWRRILDELKGSGDASLSNDFVVMRRFEQPGAEHAVHGAVIEFPVDPVYCVSGAPMPPIRESFCVVFCPDTRTASLACDLPSHPRP